MSSRALFETPTGLTQPINDTLAWLPAITQVLVIYGNALGYTIQECNASCNAMQCNTIQSVYFKLLSMIIIK